MQRVDIVWTRIVQHGVPVWQHLDSTGSDGEHSHRFCDQQGDHSWHAALQHGCDVLQQSTGTDRTTTDSFRIVTPLGIIPCRPTVQKCTFYWCCRCWKLLYDMFKMQDNIKNYLLTSTKLGWRIILCGLTSFFQSTTQWRTSAALVVTWPWSPDRASRRAQGTRCSAHTPSACWSALREDTPGSTDQRFSNKSRRPKTQRTNSHTSPSFPSFLFPT